MADAHTRTLIGIVKENVAKEMTRQTPYSVTKDMVTWVKGEAGNGVFVAHIYGNITILCKVRGAGKLEVRIVSW